MEMIEENKLMRRLLGMPTHTDAEVLKDTISLVSGFKWQDIISRSRKGELALARAMFCYVGTMRYGMHPSAISSHIERDRTTVYHGVESVGDKLYVKSPLETAMLKQINTILDHVHNKQRTPID